MFQENAMHMPPLRGHPRPRARIQRRRTNINTSIPLRQNGSPHEAGMTVMVKGSGRGQTQTFPA